MEREFIVLYTGQKQKKAKVWHDGVLKHDGKGTKAMLYDEKGGRLDSIHIKVQDITVGEQLESDRYYIEVESIKDTGAQKTGSPVVSSHNALDDRPLPQTAGFSQARCAGLKRKKTGFMPPCMVKQPRHEEEDMSQEGSAISLNNRIYPSQSSQSPGMGMPTYRSKQHQGKETPVHEMPCSSVRSGPFKSDDSLGETVLSLYSKVGGMDDRIKTLSQGSNSSAPFSPSLSLSPWSVCGAQGKQSPGRNVLPNTNCKDRVENINVHHNSNNYKNEVEKDSSVTKYMARDSNNRLFGTSNLTPERDSYSRLLGTNKDIQERDSNNRLLGTSNDTPETDPCNRLAGTSKSRPETDRYNRLLGTRRDTQERDSTNNRLLGASNDTQEGNLYYKLFGSSDGSPEMVPYNILVGTSNNTPERDSYNRFLGTSKNNPEGDPYNTSLGNSKITAGREYTEEKTKPIIYNSTSSDKAIVKSEDSPKYVTNRNMKVIMDLLRKNKQKNCDGDGRDKSVCDTNTVDGSLKPTDNVINDEPEANGLPYDNISSFDSHDFTKEWKGQVKYVKHSPSGTEELVENLSESNPASERGLDKGLDLVLKHEQRTASWSKHHINLPVVIDNIVGIESKEIIDEACEKNCDIQMSYSLEKLDTLENFASSGKNDESKKNVDGVEVGNHSKNIVNGEEVSNNSKDILDGEKVSNNSKSTVDWEVVRNKSKNIIDEEEINNTSKHTVDGVEESHTSTADREEETKDSKTTMDEEKESEGCFALNFSPLSHVTESDSEDEVGDGVPDIINANQSSSNEVESEIGQSQLKVDQITESFEDIAEMNKICDASSKEYNMSTSKADGMTKNKMDGMDNINEEVVNISKTEDGPVGKVKNDEIKNSSENIAELPKAVYGNDETHTEHELNNSNRTKYNSTQSQDTMEFSCDTLFDDSQTLYLSSPDSFKRKTISDNPEMISQSHEQETVVDSYSMFNKGVGSDAVLHLADNEVESTQSSSNSIMHLQDGVRKDIGVSFHNTEFNTDSLSSEYGVVPASGSDDDEDVYDQLYKPRLMYQQETVHGCSDAHDLRQTEGNTPYRSSLCLYKQQLAESKRFSIQPEANISSCVVDDQLKNEPSTGIEHFDINFRNNNENAADGLIRSGMKIINQIHRRDEESAIDMEASMDGISNRKSDERSKWDQYVPEQTEEEIDLTNYKRKEPVKRDFSVIETHNRSNRDLLNIADETDTMQYNRKESVKRDFSVVETRIGIRSDIDTSNINSSFAQRYNHKIDPVQAISSSPLNKDVCDTAGSMSSIDSQELMLAADDIEKHMMNIGYVGQEQFDKSKVLVELNNKTSTANDKDNSDDCDNKNDVIGLNKLSNSENCAANEDNDRHLFNESLDLSLSFEDQADILCQEKNSRSVQQPVLRVGWKPPSNKINSNHKLTCEKSNTDIKDYKVKPTFRCLKLLANSRLSPYVQSKSQDGITHPDATVVNETNVNPGSAMNAMAHKLDSPKHMKPEQVTDKSKSPSLLHKEQKQFRNLGSSSTYVRTNFKSPVISQQQNKVIEDLQPISREQTGKRFKPPGIVQVGTAVRTSEFKTGYVTNQPVNNNENVGQKLSVTELCFPGREIVEFTQNVTREVIIPATFSSVHQYKQSLTAAVIENLNTMLFEISKRYHQALSRVDTSGYTKSAVGSSGSDVSVLCKCGTAAKILSVRKEGPNKGRQFYGCNKNTQQRCKFFQWADGKVSAFNSGAGNKRKISEPHILGMYMKDQHVHFYPECQLIRKTKENLQFYFKRPKWVRGKQEEETVVKKQMFVKLPRKGHSSLYAKDDIWVISKDLDFRPSTTFLARSTFHGPLSSNELEIEPLYGYSPSNWSGEVVCHGMLAGNATTELKCLENIKEHVTSQSPRVLPQLLNREIQSVKSHGSTGFSVPRMMSTSSHTDGVLVRTDVMDDLVRKYIDEYRLNADQTEALRRVSHMFCLEKADSVDNVLLLHGVFGAGKSFLLSVMVLFLVEVFKIISSNNTSLTWKVLISSTTNVAVDRILQGVLELGFEDFVRVGSVKKIAKPILPYSIHASGTDSQELKDLQEMLRSSDLTPTEKSHVRQSIEKHRQGENKKKLGAVKVVGVTCASSSVASLNNMTFPVVFLDECSQMTEPASLLPVARFGCQKLLLVGDPKQLDPTIEGAKASHDQGLEQTMFNRLIKMGYIPTILRTQYRCHPWISAISNQLFYGDILLNGVTDMDRLPLLDVLPTICFYDVDRGQECCEGGGSFYNEREARFVVFLLQVLTSSGIESSSIGVITLYRSQMFRINDLIASCGDNGRLKGIQVSTVDAFQGGERDVIILSCVRTDACGFIDNDKRTNVALTRAKHHLLIVGHYKNLSNNYLWGKVLHHCKGHNDGVQSADETQQHLGVYLEKLSSESGSVADEMETAVQKPRKSTSKGPKSKKTKTSKTRLTSPSLNGSEKTDIDSQSSSLIDLTSDHSETSHYGTGTIDPSKETVLESRDVDWSDRTDTSLEPRYIDCNSRMDTSL